jgi:glutaredoxin
VSAASPQPQGGRLVLYGRVGCHLCDQARAVLERIGHPFEERDIEADPALHRRMLERIPVIELDDVELYDFHVDECDLRRRLGSIASV